MTDVRTSTVRTSGEDRSYQRVLLLLVMASVMAFGSMMTIVTVALGRLATDLDSSRATLTWAVTGLMLAMAVATPLAGKLGDVRGHRKVFLVGLAGCVVTTVACGLAWDGGSLIAFRALFGLSGALVVPNSMSLMMHAYGPERRATAMGWFQFAMTGAPTIGLVIGGPLIDTIGWRNLFFAFAVITAAALAASVRLLRPTPVRASHNIDYLGGVTLGITVLAALLAITRATVLLRDEGAVVAGTDALFWLLVLAATAGFIIFVRTERTAPEPMLKLEYFSRPNFTLPMVSMALVQFAYMGGFVVVPALLEDQYLWSLGAIAVLLAPRPATFSLTSPLGGYLPGRIGQKPPIIMGAVAMIASTAAFVVASGFDSGFGIVLVLAGLILAGGAAGISQPSVLAMVVDNVDDDDTGIANGMTQQIMFIGIVVGVQGMNVLAGDNATPGRFALTFGVGLVASVIGLALALLIRAPKLE
ncbi:MAG: MFS transporter [Acidimicrobiia bacterium]|nr:MFS transporter [Acidimicrobiia bacterium]